jgi:hypothetical protein
MSTCFWDVIPRPRPQSSNGGFILSDGIITGASAAFPAIKSLVSGFHLYILLSVLYMNEFHLLISTEVRRYICFPPDIKVRLRDLPLQPLYFVG